MKSIPPPPKKRSFSLPVNQVICGDNIEVVTSWPADCVDSIVTDPPYGLGFMGKDWDTFNPIYVHKCRTIAEVRAIEQTDGRKAGHGVARDAGTYDYSRNHDFQQWFTIWAKVMLRITKPGGFLLCFGGTRTVHRLACAIEDAGWQIRDRMMWLYGSGFPKSHNISKAIYKSGKKNWPDWDGSKAYNTIKTLNKSGKENWQLWDGYGTALKPAWEPIIVAMKPIDGTFAHNAEKYGVAGLNIDGGRIGTETWKHKASKTSPYGSERVWDTKGNTPDIDREATGRWPANLILDEEAGKMLDEQSGVTKSTNKPRNNKVPTGEKGIYGHFEPVVTFGHSDSGGASRFFYCAKTSRKERNMGMEDLPEKIKVWNGQSAESSKDIKPVEKRWTTKMQNIHPTVKPLALMKYLCTLLKMPGQKQTILDPFLGSGTTAMACKELGINYIGIEKEQEYCEIARKRIAAV